jgi:hypothetical protein
MKVDQHQLRHSSVRTTLEIYTHILGEEGKEAMQHVESVLLNGLAGINSVLRGLEREKHRKIQSLKTTGLGSSHTAPCGTAVPARPPTRCATLKRVGKTTNGPTEPKYRLPGF